MEKTLAIIKPDAVERSLIGKILDRIEKNGFKIVGMKMKTLLIVEAEGFYQIHKERSFFKDLTQYMSSGPVVLIVLAKENAILAWRELMGATNPKDASPGTIRKDFGLGIEQNSTHGSDGAETAKVEISYFFNQTEIEA